MSRFGSPGRRAFALGVAVALILAGAGRADDYSWNAAGGGNWNEPLKWDRTGGGTGVPITADSAAIELAGTYTVNLTDTRAVTGLTVNRSTATLNHTAGMLTTGGAFQLAAGTYTLNGGTLTQNGAMTTAAGSALNFTSGTWNGIGSAAVGGAFNWNDGALAGSGTVTLTGPVSLGGSGVSIRALGGTKTLVVAADATWSAGQIWIDNGTTFRVNAGRVLTNSDATTFWYATTTGGTFDIQGTFRKTGAGTTSFNDGVAYDVSGTVEVLGGGLSLVSGANLVGFSSDALTKGTWRVQGATLNFNGRSVATIAPNAAVVLDGPSATFAALDALTTVNGTVRILGGKTFTPTAASVANAGVLQVGAGSTFAKAINIQSTGRLEGSGTVTGAVTVGGTVAPGAAGAPVGTLTTGGQTWAGGGVYEVSYDQIFGPYTAGTDHDLLSSTGSLTVTATPANPFRIRMHSTAAEEFGRPPDVTIRIATFAGGLPPAFDLAAFRLEGDVYHGGSTFVLTTQGNDVLLTFTPVPEPATVLAVAGLALAAARRLRR